MKNLKLVLIPVLSSFFIFLNACSTVQSASDEKQLLEVSPSIPLVIFEHCLLNYGVTQDELEQGKLKGKFSLQMQSPDARLANFDVQMNPAGQASSGLVSACVQSAKDTYDHLGDRMASAVAKTRTPSASQTYTYTGDVFPVSQVHVSRNDHFLKTVRMEIAFEKATRPNSRAYRVRIYDTSNDVASWQKAPSPSEVLVSDGTVLELENKH